MMYNICLSCDKLIAWCHIFTGFIYLGTFFHEYISANQYVAPLMGNFDPSINDSAIIRYANNGKFTFIIITNGV